MTLTAQTETAARAQLAAVPHDCGETAFDVPLRRSHDARGLWFVFRGPCPRGGAQREVRVHVQAPAPFAPRVPGVAPTPRITGEEEQDLYGPTRTETCPDCEGAGEYFGVTGDYAAGMLPCTKCRGSGRVWHVVE